MSSHTILYTQVSPLMRFIRTPAHTHKHSSQEMNHARQGLFTGESKAIHEKIKSVSTETLLPLLRLDLCVRVCQWVITISKQSYSSCHCRDCLHEWNHGHSDASPMGNCRGAWRASPMITAPHPWVFAKFMSISLDNLSKFTFYNWIQVCYLTPGSLYIRHIVQVYTLSFKLLTISSSFTLTHPWGQFSSSDKPPGQTPPSLAWSLPGNATCSYKYRRGTHPCGILG